MTERMLHVQADEAERIFNWWKYNAEVISMHIVCYIFTRIT